MHNFDECEPWQSHEVADCPGPGNCPMAVEAVSVEVVIPEGVELTSEGIRFAGRLVAQKIYPDRVVLGVLNVEQIDDRHYEVDVQVQS